MQIAFGYKFRTNLPDGRGVVQLEFGYKFRTNLPDGRGVVQLEFGYKFRTNLPDGRGIVQLEFGYNSAGVENRVRPQYVPQPVQTDRKTCVMKTNKTGDTLSTTKRLHKQQPQDVT